MTTAPVLNRREFLKTGAAGGAALVVAFHFPGSAYAAAQDQEKKTPNPFNAGVRITPDNRVTLILGKSEMGQRAMTALPMILAEELYLDSKQVSVEPAPAETSGIVSRRHGMEFAFLACSPVFRGKVAKFEATKAKAVLGVRDVISIAAVGQGAFTSGGVVVLANNSWAAIQGRKSLNITWDEGPNADESSESLRKHFIENAAKPGKVVRNEGDADAALSSASRKIEAAYELPFAPHACMEPMNCTVHIRPDGAEAWVPTQAPQWAQGVIAQVSGLPPEKVIVHTTLMGGGFGRRYQPDFGM